MAIDISRTRQDRARNQAKVEALRRAHPRVPIAVLYPETLGERTLVYTAARPARLLAAGRDAGRHLLDADRAPTAPRPVRIFPSPAQRSPRPARS